MAVVKLYRTFRYSITITLQVALIIQVVQTYLRMGIRQISWTRSRARSSSRVKLTSLRLSNLFSTMVALKTRTSPMTATLSNKTSLDHRINPSSAHPKPEQVPFTHTRWIMRRLNSLQHTLKKLRWLKWKGTPICPWLKRRTSRKWGLATCKELKIQLREYMVSRTNNWKTSVTIVLTHQTLQINRVISIRRGAKHQKHQPSTNCLAAPASSTPPLKTDSIRR